MTWTIFAAAAGLLVLWFCVRGFVRKQALAVPLQWIWFPALLFAAVCLWALLQSLSLTPDMLHHPLWKEASKALGQEMAGAISVNPYATGTALLRLMTYGAVFWLALQLGRERKQADFVLHGIVFAIAGFALYGLMLWSTGSTTILWYEKWVSGNRITSVFVNPNNFATFAGLGCIAFLALLARSLRGGFGRREGELAKHRVNRLVHTASGIAGIYLLALATSMGALFLSGSRGGFFATLFAMTILFAMNLLKGRVGIFSMAIVLAAASAVFIFLFDLGGELLVERIQQSEMSAEHRTEVYKLILQAIADSPWLGTGYGTFRDIFPIYRDQTISPWGVWDMAHNTWLENMLELGIPSAVALFVAIGMLAGLCLRGVLRRRRGGHFPLIGFAVSVLVAVHSLVDFSLQIPGVAITYAALLGLGVAQSWSSRKR